MQRVLDFVKRSWHSLLQEFVFQWEALRSQRLTIGLALAIMCVFFIIVGNVMLLIALNFWLSIFPEASVGQNSFQIGIQVVATLFIFLFFLLVAIVFCAFYGLKPIYHVLFDTNRMLNPWLRFLLLFASGATNAISSVLGVYAMTYTPEFLQAVLMCCIPFSAQAWSILFIQEDRHRNYLSLFFIFSFIFMVAGILLSSMSAFLAVGEDGTRVSWEWALIYLASSIVFGLWCVVQRLYLDGMVVRTPLTDGKDVKADAADDDEEGAGAADDTAAAAAEENEDDERAAGRDPHAQDTMHGEPFGTGSDGDRVDKACSGKGDSAAPHSREKSRSGGGGGAREEREGDDGVMEELRSADDKSGLKAGEGDATEGRVHIDDDEEEGFGEGEEAASGEEEPLVPQRKEWGAHSLDDNASKLVLLVVGIFFQVLVSFAVLPVDAIPWFGTSDSARHAWDGFSTSVVFIFESWYNVRFGLLYSLGYVMSFIGCTFLNEHSPTLASVVMQLAGPITSIVILIIPQWNVYQDHGNAGHKAGGVVLLVCAALLYHMWDQQSMRVLAAWRERQERKRRLRQQQQREEEEAAQAAAQAAEREEELV